LRRFHTSPVQKPFLPAVPHRLVEFLLCAQIAGCGILADHLFSGIACNVAKSRIDRLYIAFSIGDGDGIVAVLKMLACNNNLSSSA